MPDEITDHQLTEITEQQLTEWLALQSEASTAPLKVAEERLHHTLSGETHIGVTDQTPAQNEIGALRHGDAVFYVAARLGWPATIRALRAIRRELYIASKLLTVEREAYKRCTEDASWACAICIAEIYEDDAIVHEEKRDCPAHGRTVHWRLGSPSSVLPEAIGGAEPGDHERDMGEE